MRTINLYGEADGITVDVDTYGQISSLDDTPEDELTRVVGHRLYACGLGEARERIVAEAQSRGLVGELE